MSDDHEETRLRQLRKEAGYRHASEFARKHGFEVVTYRSAENSNRGIPVPAAKRYAEALSKELGRPVSWMFLIDEDYQPAPTADPDSLPPQVPVIGKAGAAIEFLPFDDYPQGAGFRYVDPPPNEPDTVALEVEGLSQYPQLLPGWLIFFRRREEGVPSDCIGKLCLVKLTDGSALLKTVRRGSQKNRFNLESWNAPLMENRSLEWATRILDIRPQ